MKRSEVINELSKYLSFYLGEDNKVIVNHLADGILDKLYDIGMQPPLDDKYKDWYVKELGYNDWDHYLDNNGFSEDQPVGGWEPENE